MKRLLALTGGLLAISLALSVWGYASKEKEAWLAATAFGVCTGVAALVLLIAAIVERRWGHAIGALGLGGFGVLAAYLDLLIGAVVMADPAGRPLRVKGRRIHARVRAGCEWGRGPAPDVSALDAGTRRRRGQKWLREARAEHASVPAFARLAWQLSAHGAPPQLIARAHVAALEEIEHARRCFALAGAYLGEPQTVEPLPLGALEPGTREALALESALDGWVREGEAADRALAASRRERDPVVRALYEQIAREERGHAELARDIVKWARGG